MTMRSITGAASKHKMIPLGKDFLLRYFQHRHLADGKRVAVSNSTWIASERRS